MKNETGDRLEAALDILAEKFAGELEAIAQGRRRVVVLMESRIDGRGTVAYRLAFEDVPQKAEPDFALATAGVEKCDAIGCGQPATYIGYQYPRPGELGYSAGVIEIRRCEMHAPKQTVDIGRSAPCDVCGGAGEFRDDGIARCDHHERDRKLLAGEPVELPDCAFIPDADGPCGKPGFSAKRVGEHLEGALMVGEYESRCVEHSDPEEIF